MSRIVRPFHCRPILAGSLSKMATMSKPRCRNPRYWTSALPIFPAPIMRDPIAPLEAQDLAQPVGQLRAPDSPDRACRTIRRTRGPSGPGPRWCRRATRARPSSPCRCPAPRTPRESADRATGGEPWNRRLCAWQAFCEMFHKATALTTLRQRALAAAGRTPPGSSTSGRAPSARRPAREAAATRLRVPAGELANAAQHLLAAKPEQARPPAAGSRPAPRRDERLLAAASAAAPPSPPWAGDGTRRPERVNSRSAWATA